MATEIKPIETRYNGYRFRSRLEAKWAVYFDQLGVRYEYEPQGYVLPDGKCYLPDFYLPEFNAFVEIKPNAFGIVNTIEAKMKAEQIARQLHKYFLICFGDPVNNSVEIFGTIQFGNDQVLPNDSVSCWQPAEFIIGAEMMDDDFITYRRVFNVGIVVGGRYSNSDFSFSPFEEKPVYNIVPFNKLYGFDRIPHEEQEYARQSRFEHGECG